MIGADILLDLYKSYYSNPTPNNWKKLCIGILDYDFSGYLWFLKEIQRLPITKSALEFVKLKTNTGNRYPFGPNANLVIKDIENHLRYQKTIRPKGLFFVREEIKENKIYGDFRTSKGKFHSILVTDLWKNSQKICEYILANSSESFILGYPYSIGQLIGNVNFLTKMEGSLKGFVNADSQAFFNTSYIPSSITVNDQMINWVTGVNFYTCRFGKKHFLPIFLRSGDSYFNLLCLIQTPRPIDDEFSIRSDFCQCECGKFYCEFDFRSHVRNFISGYDLSTLSNELHGRYRWIQFVQSCLNEFQVFYELSSTATNIRGDMEKIKNLLGGKVKFRKGDYFQVGSKFPCFWKEDKEIMFQ